MIGIKNRNDLVEGHLYLVRAIARKLIMALPPCFDIEELVSAGNLGLVTAAEKFSPFRGVKFATYAQNRIKGAMLDSVRRKNWDAATAPHFEDFAIGRRVRQGQLHESKVIQEPEHTPAPIVSIDAKKRREVLVVAIDELSERERKLIVQHYFQGKRLSEAGRNIGVKTTRTTQIHSIALAKMKRSLLRRNVKDVA
jgi:RNA polymerase sigma factor for flagellar operon FliA